MGGGLGIDTELANTSHYLTVQKYSGDLIFKFPAQKMTAFWILSVPSVYHLPPAPNNQAASSRPLKVSVVGLSCSRPSGFRALQCARRVPFRWAGPHFAAVPPHSESTFVSASHLADGHPVHCSVFHS